MLPLLWRLLTTKIAVAFSLWSNKRIHSSKSFSKARERITVSFGGGSNTAAAERIITRQSLGIAHWKGGMQQTSERALSAAQHHHLPATVARPRRKLVFLRLSLEGFQVSTFGRYWSEPGVRFKLLNWRWNVCHLQNQQGSWCFLKLPARRLHYFISLFWSSALGGLLFSYYSALPSVGSFYCSGNWKCCTNVCASSTVICALLPPCSVVVGNSKYRTLYAQVLWLLWQTRWCSGVATAASVPGSLACLFKSSPLTTIQAWWWSLFTRPNAPSWAATAGAHYKICVLTYTADNSI